MTGPSTTSAANTPSAPMPTVAIWWAPSPEAIAYPPPAASSVPITARRFEVADRSMAVSRSASIGATLAALRAGT